MLPRVTIFSSLCYFDLPRSVYILLNFAVGCLKSLCIDIKTEKQNPDVLLYTSIYVWRTPPIFLYTQISWEEEGFKSFTIGLINCFMSFNFLVYKIGIIVLNLSFLIVLKVIPLFCSTFRRFSHIEDFQQVSFSWEVWRMFYQLLLKIAWISWPEHLSVKVSHSLLTFGCWSFMIQWIIFTLKVKSDVQEPIGMLEMLNKTVLLEIIFDLLI